MSPYLELRLWLREGPLAERVLSGVVGLLVLALVALALVPVSNSSSAAQAAADGSGTGVVGIGPVPVGTQRSAGPSATPSATGAPGAPGSGPTDVPGSVGPSTPGVAGGPPPSGPCAARAASGPGVTANEVHLVTTNLSLAGPIGNSTFDVRPDLAAIAKAYADDINAKGGVACGRKIVLKQYDVNPLDPSDGQTKCLQIQQDAPLLVIDFGGYLTPAARSCFGQAKIPLTTATAFGSTELKSAYPYLFGLRNQSEEQARNGILGLNARGFFKAPAFRKLGIFEDSCDPSVNRQIAASLTAAGIKANQISTFVLDCNLAAPPNQISQAVLQHKVDGASHVLLATSTTNDQNYVRLALGQNFRPKYGASDYGEVMTQAGAENWDASFNGAVGVTSGHLGEFNSGKRSPELIACDKIAKAHGVAGFTSERKDTALMGYCDLFAFFKAAVNAAGINPTRASLAQGVASIGLHKTSSLGDGLFNRPGKVTGGDFQREVQYHSDCGCWKIVDANFGPAYR